MHNIISKMFMPYYNVGMLLIIYILCIFCFLTRVKQRITFNAKNLCSKIHTYKVKSLISNFISCHRKCWSHWKLMPCIRNPSLILLEFSVSLGICTLQHSFLKFVVFLNLIIAKFSVKADFLSNIITVLYFP